MVVTKTTNNMSKGNMLLGHARGKVGSLVFSRSNGQQVVRARAEVVKNPRTETQLIQRIFLNTVSQAYSKMQPIVDHSFEGVAPGQASMSFFMKKNLDKIRAYVKTQLDDDQSYDDIVAFTALGENYISPNNYIIAKGSLPEVLPTFTGSTAGKIENISANTYEGVINSLGLQRGDQITFITMQGSMATGVDFHFARVILDPINADLTEAPLSTPFIDAGAINKPNGRNEGTFNTLEYDVNAIKYSFSAKAVVATAIIISRKNIDGSWKRSNATLALNEAATVGSFPSLQECLDAAQSSEITSVSQRYLNNAGKGKLPGQTAAGAGTIEVTAATVNGKTITKGETKQLEAADNGSNRAVSCTIATQGEGDFAVILQKRSGMSWADHKTMTISGTTASTTVTLGNEESYRIVTKVNGGAAEASGFAFDTDSGE